MFANSHLFYLVPYTSHIHVPKFRTQCTRYSLMHKRVMCAFESLFVTTEAGMETPISKRSDVGRS